MMNGKRYTGRFALAMAALTMMMACPASAFECVAGETLQVSRRFAGRVSSRSHPLATVRALAHPLAIVSALAR